MKKIFSGLLTGIIIISLSTSNAKAQASLEVTSDSPAKATHDMPYMPDYRNKGDEKTKVSKDDMKASKANLKAIEANFKATKDFKKEFKDVTDAKWFVDPNVMGASFYRDGIQTRVMYNKKGNWLHTILWYNENKIPKDIKSLVRSNYPLYDITGMNEIKEGNIIFYIIHLEDEIRYKEITLYNGELNDYREFTKE